MFTDQVRFEVPIDFFRLDPAVGGFRIVCETNRPAFPENPAFGAASSQPSGVFIEDYHGQAVRGYSGTVSVHVDLAEGVNVQVMAVEYECRLEFNSQSEGAQVEWLVVPGGEDASTAEDVRVRAREGTPPSTTVRGTVEGDGQLVVVSTDPIRFTGVTIVPLTEPTIIEDHVENASPVVLPQPHPANLLTFIARKCEPSVVNEDEVLEVAQDVLSTCRGCHNNQAWRPNGCPDQYPDLFEVDANDREVPTPDSHPDSLGVNCRTCHETQTWAVLLNLDQVRCHHCHRELFQEMNAFRACFLPTVYERPAHVPERTWRLFETYGDYVRETEDEGCSILSPDDPSPAPGGDTWCVQFPAGWPQAP